MSRADVFEEIASAGFPVVSRKNGERLAGHAAYSRFCSFAPIAEVNHVLHQVRRLGVAAPSWPIELPMRRDDDRDQRLRAAQSTQPMTVTLRQPMTPTAPGPTAAHWRAVRLALEKFCGIGEYRAYVTPRSLPEYSIHWNKPTFLRENVIGSTVLQPDGRIELHLRSDLNPDRLHRNVLHEAQHIFDLAFYPCSRAEMESRAEATALSLAWL
jgi:hypothetical protein